MKYGTVLRVGSRRSCPIFNDSTLMHICNNTVRRRDEDTTAEDNPTTTIASFNGKHTATLFPHLQI